MLSREVESLLRVIGNLSPEEKEAVLKFLQASHVPVEAAGQPGVNDGNVDSEPSSNAQDGSSV